MFWQELWKNFDIAVNPLIKFSFQVQLTLAYHVQWGAGMQTNRRLIDIEEC